MSEGVEASVIYVRFKAAASEVTVLFSSSLWFYPKQFFGIGGRLPETVVTSVGRGGLKVSLRLEIHGDLAYLVQFFFK